MIKTSLANLSLRSLTLASKFLLILFIAKFLTPEELGIWGLIFIFTTGLISWKYAVWFYILLILEHISQELYRLLITFSRPIVANLVLFLRSGAWIYFAIGIAYYYKDSRGLSLFWASWTVGVGISIVLAVYLLRKLNWKDALAAPVDWQWIKKGVRISFPFFISTIAFTGIQFFDRYFIQHYHGEALVGIYTFYANIANVINTFIFNGVIVILYPRLVQTFQAGNHEAYREHMRKLTTGIIIGLIILPVLAALLINPVLDLVGKQIYKEYSYIFYIMMGTVTCLTLSYIPHYSLFVRHKDKVIIHSAVAAVVISLIANRIFVPQYALSGAAWAALGSMAVLLVYKAIAALKYRSNLEIPHNDTRPAAPINNTRGL